jgi:hypothetical protein
MSTGPTDGIRSQHAVQYIDERLLYRMILIMVCATTSIIFYAYTGPWGIIVGVVPMYLITLF